MLWIVLALLLGVVMIIVGNAQAKNQLAMESDGLLDRIKREKPSDELAQFGHAEFRLLYKKAHMKIRRKKMLPMFILLPLPILFFPVMLRDPDFGIGFMILYVIALVVLAIRAVAASKNADNLIETIREYDASKVALK